MHYAYVCDVIFGLEMSNVKLTGDGVTGDMLKTSFDVCYVFGTLQRGVVKMKGPNWLGR